MKFGFEVELNRKWIYYTEEVQGELNFVVPLDWLSGIFEKYFSHNYKDLNTFLDTYEPETDGDMIHNLALEDGVIIEDDVNYKKIIINNEVVYIEELCYDLVKFFNDIGLTTFSSCQGHDCFSNFEIVFDESVDDVQIYEFVKDYKDELYNFFPFYKWVRFVDSKLYCNWIFIIDSVFLRYNDKAEVINNIYTSFLNRKNELEK